ncbi:MAG: sulfatase-like hydrolase/transferase [Opitutaceae bacterium]|nr:sulfatase-like hydrolase/transferase [Opitutaceae bacterium]
MTPKPPDILLILTTQLRAQALAHAGDPNAVTPVLDALAATSRRFTQAVTPHPFGPHARAALLTGVPSPQNGVSGYFDPLPTSRRTIAHDLNERGWRTAFLGKWHLSRRDPAAPLVGETHARQTVPENARGGFQFWRGFESGFLLNAPFLHGTGLPVPTRFPGYQPDVILRQAAACFLDNTGPGKPPFFLLASLETPHPPYDAPAAGIRPVPPDNILLPPNVPLGGETEQRARRELSGYHAHITATDRAIGRLLDAIAPRAASTAIIFTSVHGDMHGSHGLFRKGWPHEESVRVPLLVKLPGQPAAADHRLASLLDIPRWLLAIAGNRDPFPPGWNPAAQTLSMPCAVGLPFQCDRPWRAVRTASAKQVFNTDGSLWLQDV